MESMVEVQKANLEIELEQAGKNLILAEQERQEAAIEKKNMESEFSVFKKDIEDFFVYIIHLLSTIIY